MSKTHIIADMACSHDGDVNLAKKIIDGAGSADSIQFQIWDFSELKNPDKELAEIELSQTEWAELVKYTRAQFPSMEIIACVYETRSVDFCEEIGIDAYKLHHTSLTYSGFVKHVASTGKRINMTVGFWGPNEIGHKLEWIPDSPIWLMAGYQNFPTLPGDISLDYIKHLLKLFELPVGYQDHSDANTIEAYTLPIYTMGLGATIQEKHITHDRALKGYDHESALNPDEFELFVERIRTVDKSK